MPRDETASSSEQTARLFNEAIKFHQRGVLDQAEKLYRQVLTHLPHHFHSLHLLGVIASQRGNHAAAIEQIDAALKINQNDADALNNRGNVLLDLKRPDEALFSFDRALLLNPNHVGALNNRGNALVELQR